MATSMVSGSIVVIAERTKHGGAERQLQAQHATVNEQQQRAQKAGSTTCDALATGVSAAADATDSADAADSADSANATAAGAGAGAAAEAAAAAGAAGSADEWGDVMSEVSQHQQGDDLPSEQGDEPTINE